MPSGRADLPGKGLVKRLAVQQTGESVVPGEFNRFLKKSGIHHLEIIAGFLHGTEEIADRGAQADLPAQHVAQLLPVADNSVPVFLGLVLFQGEMCENMQDDTVCFITIPLNYLVEGLNQAFFRRGAAVFKALQDGITNHAHVYPLDVGYH